MTLPRPEARGIRAVYGKIGGPAHSLIHLFKDGDGNLNGFRELVNWAKEHHWEAVDLFDKAMKELEERKLA